MLYSVKQTAPRLGVSAALVYALCAVHKLRHSRVGLGRGKIVISEEAIAEYLRGREVGVETKPPPAPRRKLTLHHLDLS